MCSAVKRTNLPSVGLPPTKKEPWGSWCGQHSWRTRGETYIVEHDVDEKRGHERRIASCECAGYLLLFCVSELTARGVEFEDRHVGVKMKGVLLK